MLLQHLLADFSGIGRGRGDRGVKGLHDGAAERFLLIGALNHKDV